jgi:nitrosocyanin
MNKLYLVLVFVLVLGGGYVVMKKAKMAPPVTPPTSAVVTSTPAAAMEQGAVKEFAVEGGMFYFTPKEIKVKKGDTVKITFTNKEGFHDWVLDEFNAKTKQIKAGETDTISFVADKAGTFEYYCSVGNHRAQGMKGNLIVE